LIVPVIKHAEEKSFLGLARAINDLAARTRTKKLTPDDIQGGTFTISNYGVFGSLIVRRSSTSRRLRFSGPELSRRGWW